MDDKDFTPKEAREIIFRKLTLAILSIPKTIAPAFIEYINVLRDIDSNKIQNKSVYLEMDFIKDEFDKNGYYLAKPQCVQQREASEISDIENKIRSYTNQSGTGRD